MSTLNLSAGLNGFNVAVGGSRGKSKFFDVSRVYGMVTPMEELGDDEEEEGATLYELMVNFCGYSRSQGGSTSMSVSLTREAASNLAKLLNDLVAATEPECDDGLKS